MMETSIQIVRFLAEFEACAITGNHPDKIMISIRENGQAPLKAVFLDTLRLEFHDIDAPLLYNGEMLIPFTEEQAKAVIDFLFEYKDKATEVIVHCQAGISRSAGVAKFIAELFDLPFNHGYPLYNKCVYGRLRRVFYEKFYEDS